MSHIVTNKKEMEHFIDLLKFVPKDYLDKDALNYLLLSMTPKNESKSMLTDYKVFNTLPLGGAYLPKYKTIVFSLPLINNWINMNTNEIRQKFNIEDYDLLRQYVSIYPIIHEVEHAYQHMMGLKEIKAPNAKVGDGYRYLFDFLMNKNQRFIDQFRRFKTMRNYNKNKEDYVLERNANFETTTLLTNVALYRGDLEIADAFQNLSFGLIYKAYKNDNKGPMYHTFKDLKLLDEYNNIRNYNDLDFMSNVRYGLEITEEERLSLIKK